MKTGDYMSIVVKKIDPQGRLLLPKEIRAKLGDTVIIVDLGDRVEILPRKKHDLTKYFNVFEIEELKEWDEMKKDLFG